MELFRRRLCLKMVVLRHALLLFVSKMGLRHLHNHPTYQLEWHAPSNSQGLGSPMALAARSGSIALNTGLRE